MKNDNIHKEHRARMRAKYEKYGESPFETHQLTEMMLFGFINQKDTNTVAHEVTEVLSKKNIFEVSPAELCEVSGIGARTASGMKISADCIRRLLCDRLERSGFDSEFSRRLYFYLKMLGKPGESICAAVMSDKNRVLDFSDVTASFMPVDNFVKGLLKKSEMLGGSGVILCHSHGNGTAKISAEDLYMTSIMKKKLEGTGVSLICHYIVNDRDCVLCTEEESNDR